MRLKISQRDALMYKKRCIELEKRESARQNRWPQDYPGGVNFYSVAMTSEATAACTAAAVLGHYIVAIPSGAILRLYGIPFPK